MGFYSDARKCQTAEEYIVVLRRHPVSPTSRCHDQRTDDEIRREWRDGITRPVMTEVSVQAAPARAVAAMQADLDGLTAQQRRLTRGTPEWAEVGVRMDALACEFGAGYMPDNPYPVQLVISNGGDLERALTAHREHLQARRLPMLLRRLTDYPGAALNGYRYTLEEWQSARQELQNDLDICLASENQEVSRIDPDEPDHYNQSVHDLVAMARYRVDSCDTAMSQRQNHVKE